MKVYEINGTTDVKEIIDTINRKINNVNDFKIQSWSCDLEKDITNILRGLKAKTVFKVDIGIGVEYQQPIAFLRANYEDKSAKEVKEIIRERVGYLFESIDDIIVDAKAIQREALEFNPIPKRYRKN